MRLFIAIILGLVGLAALVYLAYVRFPRTRYISYNVAKMVAEERELTFEREIEVRGEPVKIKMTIPVTVSKALQETRRKEIAPAFKEYVAFSIVTGIALIFGGYMVVIVLALARDKWKQGRQTESTKDTQRRMDAIVTFSTGVLVGVIGSSGNNLQDVQPQSLPNDEIIISSEHIGPSSEIDVGVVGDPNTPKLTPR